jgi:hypothetical protein
MDSTFLISKRRVAPEVKAGDRVSAMTRRGRVMATVLLRSGFRLRVKTDSGREFSIDRGSVWLLPKDMV